MAVSLSLVHSQEGAREGAVVAAEQVRVLVADAQALVRAGFRALLEGDATISVVGEAADGERALALARHLRPDVILLDVSLPADDPSDTIRELLAESGGAVMVLIGSEEDERSFAALRAGAHGVLPKDIAPSELVRAVRLLARGDALVSPRLTRRLITEYAARAAPLRPTSERVAELTEREREVVSLVALGLSNDAIAERLVVSPATSKTHVSRAMVKLGARDRAQLVVFAYECGLVPAGSPGTY
jgi:DNA-binding NarL/FixJ family response regulator